MVPVDRVPACANRYEPGFALNGVCWSERSFTLDGREEQRIQQKDGFVELEFLLGLSLKRGYVEGLSISPVWQQSKEKLPRHLTTAIDAMTVRKPACCAPGCKQSARFPLQPSRCELRSATHRQAPFVQKDRLQRSSEPILRLRASCQSLCYLEPARPASRHRAVIGLDARAEGNSFPSAGETRSLAPH